MRDKLWLFIVTGKAALITVVLVFAFVLALSSLQSRFLAASSDQTTLVGIATLLSMGLAVGLAAFWMFRTLIGRLTQREARAVALSFGVLAPVWLGISMLLGELSGGYAAMLGSFFGFAGAFIGVALAATSVSFALCLLTLLITRHIVRLEPAQD